MKLRPPLLRPRYPNLSGPPASRCQDGGPGPADTDEAGTHARHLRRDGVPTNRIDEPRRTSSGIGLGTSCGREGATREWVVARSPEIGAGGGPDEGPQSTESRSLRTVDTRPPPTPLRRAGGTVQWQRRQQQYCNSGAHDRPDAAAHPTATVTRGQREERCSAARDGGLGSRMARPARNSSLSGTVRARACQNLNAEGYCTCAPLGRQGLSGVQYRVAQPPKASPARNHRR